MDRLLGFFMGTESETLESVGSEVETQFVDTDGRAVSTSKSQQMLGFLAKKDWRITAQKGQLITALTDRHGNQIFYELGRHNIEISTAPTVQKMVVPTVYDCLEQLYTAAKSAGCTPYHEPVLETDEDLLVIPDERDATWLDLDGRTALALLARTSSVQFTFSVNPNEAIKMLNRLGWKAGKLLDDYPQDDIWKEYITNSNAEYLSDRYGGPLIFESVKDYCLGLTQHHVVTGSTLVPYRDAIKIDIPLYLRSIWWHFRLKRYNNDLCIEVRPMPRRSDSHIRRQFETVLDMISA